MIPALIGLVAVSALVGTVAGMLYLTALLADVFRLERYFRRR
jgi:hypothetical protein